MLEKTPRECFEYIADTPFNILLQDSKELVVRLVNYIKSLDNVQKAILFYKARLEPTVEAIKRFAVKLLDDMIYVVRQFLNTSSEYAEAYKYFGSLSNNDKKRFKEEVKNAIKEFGLKPKEAWIVVYRTK